MRDAFPGFNFSIGNGVKPRFLHLIERGFKDRLRFKNSHKRLPLMPIDHTFAAFCRDDLTRPD